jgi:hypothetical protein
MKSAQREFIFTAPGENIDLTELAEEYPLKQTQALILAIDETSAWAAEASEMFGTPDSGALVDYAEWIVEVEDLLENLRDAIDDDKDLMKCRLRGDDEWYEAVDETLSRMPNDNIEFAIEQEEAEQALLDALNRMTGFWIEQVQKRLVTVLQLMSGDGEVLSIVARYQRCKQI